MGHTTDQGYTRPSGRDLRPSPEIGAVRFATVDITSELQVHSVQATSAAACCSACQRRLLPGETLHVYEARSLCTLCAGVLTEAPLRRERIRAGAVGIAVVPRAA